MRKLAYVLGVVAVVFAAATTFRLVTGECPVGCLIKHFHSEKTAAPAPTNAN